LFHFGSAKVGLLLVHTNAFYVYLITCAGVDPATDPLSHCISW